MDGENNGSKPYEQMDHFLEGFPIIFGNTQLLKQCQLSMIAANAGSPKHPGEESVPVCHTNVVDLG